MPAPAQLYTRENIPLLILVAMIPPLALIYKNTWRKMPIELMVSIVLMYSSHHASVLFTLYCISVQSPRYFEELNRYQPLDEEAAHHIEHTDSSPPLKGQFDETAPVPSTQIAMWWSRIRRNYRNIVIWAIIACTYPPAAMSVTVSPRGIKEELYFFFAFMYCGRYASVVFALYCVLVQLPRYLEELNGYQPLDEKAADHIEHTDSSSPLNGQFDEPAPVPSTLDAPPQYDEISAQGHVADEKKSGENKIQL